MSDKSKIEWCDASWQPVVGCSKVSIGCQNCYAERMMYRQVCMGAARHEKNPDSNDDAWIAYSDVIDEDTHKWNGEVSLRYSQLDKPLHWRKPRMIFVCSMSDLFHPSVPFNFIDKVMQIISMYPQQHTYQILTKRPEMAKRYFEQLHKGLTKFHKGKEFQWPFTNLWLGVTAENQGMADKRIPILLQIPAAVRFVSIEPMLEPVDLEHLNIGMTDAWQMAIGGKYGTMPDWVIIGCESGPKRRPCKLEWMLDIVWQCKDADVSVFVKQVSINGKVSHDPAEWPRELRVRQYPQAQETEND